MDDKIKLLASQLGESRLKVNFNLKDELQTRMGGVVSSFYIATNQKELVRVVSLCQELNLQFFLIGLGSKIALKNKFAGLVIKNRSDNLKIFGIKGKVSRNGIGIEEAFVEAESGITLARLSDFVIKQGLGGFEDLASSVGTVGGSIMVNLILREKTAQVKILEHGQVRTKELVELLGSDIVLSVIFKLKAKKD